MKIAVLKSIGSGGKYPMPIALITNFLAPFFLQRGWRVSDFAVIERSASYIMLAEEGEAEDVAKVLQEFAEYADKVAHATETREELIGVKHPSLYLYDLSLLAVMGKSDRDANIFGGYVAGGLIQKADREVAELTEKIRELGNKFRLF